MRVKRAWRRWPNFFKVLQYGSAQNSLCWKASPLAQPDSAGWWGGFYFCTFLNIRCRYVVQWTSCMRRAVLLPVSQLWSLCRYSLSLSSLAYMVGESRGLYFCTFLAVIEGAYGNVIAGSVVEISLTFNNTHDSHKRSNGSVNSYTYMHLFQTTMNILQRWVNVVSVALNNLSTSNQYVESYVECWTAVAPMAYWMAVTDAYTYDTVIQYRHY